MKKLIAVFLALIMVFANITSGDTRTEASSKVDEMMMKMSTRDKIGQVIMPDFRFWKQEGESKEKAVTRLNDEIKKIINDYRFGGVILFAQNVEETEQTTRLTDDLQKTAIDANLPPLLLTIDQEGGIVVRLGTGTSLPGNMALGATRSEKLAYEYGRIIGEELNSLGINVDLAPVLDVNNNPKNPVIGLRSISSDPQLVGTLGSKVIKGIQDQNVSATVKHFPGHGDTDVDSHLGMPLVDKSKEEVLATELAPFMIAAQEGVDMILTAHIAYPQLESDTAISKLDGKPVHIPATLSDDILTGILRDEMKFDGVVITDAMVMQAIKDHFGEAESAVMSFKAGADIVLMPTVLRSKEDLAKLDAIYDLFEKSLENGELSKEKLDTSVRRILTLKEKRGILNLEQYNTPIEDKVQNALKVVGSQEHLDMQRKITQAAITVGRNDNLTLPLTPKAGEKVLMLAAYENELPGLNYGIDLLQREGVVNNEVEYKSIRFNGETTRENLETWMEGYNYVIVISEIYREKNLNPDTWLTHVPDMVLEIAEEKNITPVVLSISKPYDLARYPKAPAIVLTYGAKGMDPTEKGQDPVKTFGPNIPYALDVVFGKVKAQGKLPVDIPVIDENYMYTNEIAYPFGYGLTTILSENKDLGRLKSGLSTLLDVARDLTTKDLTDQSHNDLLNAIDEAENKLESESLEELVNATTSLKNTINSLEFKPAVQIAGYMSKDSAKFDAPNGNKIGTIRIGNEVNGTIKGDYLEIEKNGEVFYVSKYDIQLYPVLAGGYAKFTQYIRDYDENIVGTLDKNEYVIGQLIGDRVYINFDMNTKVWKVNLVPDEIFSKGYTKFNMNLRDKKGDIIGVIPKGTLVKGTVEGSRVLVNYNGKEGYVYSSNLSEKEIRTSGYTRAIQNVRDIYNNKVITLLDAGRYVSGIVNNGKVEVTVNGKTGYIYDLTLKPNREVYSGKAEVSQYIRDNNEKIVGILPKGVKILGKVDGSRLLIKYNGVQGKVWLKNIK